MRTVINIMMMFLIHILMKTVNFSEIRMTFEKKLPDVKLREREPVVRTHLKNEKSQVG